MKPPYPERYRLRVAELEQELPAHGTTRPPSLVLFGDSISQAHPATTLRGLPVVNMGIGGDEAEHPVGGLLRRVHLVPRANPKHVFMLIGINDLNRPKSPETVANDVSQVLSNLVPTVPAATVHLQSLLPTSGQYLRLLADVRKLNSLLPLVARTHTVRYLDMVSAFSDEKGELREELTYDGLHLNDAGYEVWTSVIEAAS